MSNDNKTPAAPDAELPVVAWLEHHKGGDNLNWEQVDHAYAKATPLCDKNKAAARIDALVRERDEAEKQLIDARDFIGRLNIECNDERAAKLCAEAALREAQKDAERWNMLPAFLEKYQINYVFLLADIDAAIGSKK